MVMAQKCNTALVQKIKKRRSANDENLFVNTLSIVIPVLGNKKGQLGTLLKKIAVINLINGIQKEIVIVIRGNNSVQLIDDFIATNEQLHVKLFHYQPREGKNIAIKTGIRNATGEVLIIQEIDFPHAPDHYSDLLKAIITGKSNIVFGIVGNMPQGITGRVFTSLSNLFTQFHFTNVKSSYKIFETKVLKRLGIGYNILGFEWELVQKMSRDEDVRFAEKPLRQYKKEHH